jgi:dipeptidase E
MKFYLSSYKLGNETQKLTELINKTSGKFGYIPNALDFTSADPNRKIAQTTSNMEELKNLGADIELLDLKNYFGNESLLRDKLQNLGGLYVCGGNTFVLRQAMKLSGLDKLIIEMSDREDFLYIAYSAGVCVLTKTLRYYAITDDANDFPYSQIKETIWDGLGILDFVFEPHYDSNHPESESTDNEIKKLIDDKVLFKAYRDGEVLII